MFRLKFLFSFTFKEASKLNNRLIKTSNFCKVQQSFFCSAQKISDETEEKCDLPSALENKKEEVVPRLKSLEPGSAANFKFSEYGSALQPSYNFAAYADQSPVLQELVKLGVELYKLEKDPKLGEFLLTLDFQKDIKPYLLFLRDNGIHPDKFGSILSKNPYLLKEDVENLKVRINYLYCKKFSQKVICVIIEKCPKWLSIPVKVVDRKLGFLQTLLDLTGHEVRKMIAKTPSLIYLGQTELSVMLFVLKEDLGYDKYTIKKMCVEYPRILKKDGNEIIKMFDYFIKEMHIPKELIAKQTYALSYRIFRLKARHQFLQSLGRAQYNPKLPGYVSLIELLQTHDEEFCTRIAKSNLLLYNVFLKTL